MRIEELDGYECDGQMSMVEEWRDISGYDGLFQVSNFGNVKSLQRDVYNHTGIIHKPERILKQQYSQKGYKVISLQKDGIKKRYSVHRLVAIAFIENANNKPQINHIDGDKENNCVWNLEWCTNQENQIHAIKNGLNDRSKYNPGKPMKAVLQIDPVTNEIIREYKSVADASREMNGARNISACCKGHRNTVRGYVWKYKEREVM